MNSWHLPTAPLNGMKRTHLRYVRASHQKSTKLYKDTNFSTRLMLKIFFLNHKSKIKFSFYSIESSLMYKYHVIPKSIGGNWSSGQPYRAPPFERQRNKEKFPRRMTCTFNFIPCFAWRLCIKSTENSWKNSWPKCPTTWNVKEKYPWYVKIHLYYRKQCEKVHVDSSFVSMDATHIYIYILKTNNSPRL